MQNAKPLLKGSEVNNVDVVLDKPVSILEEGRAKIFDDVDWAEKMLREALATPLPKPQFDEQHREWERKAHQFAVDAYAHEHRRDITEVYRAAVSIFKASAAWTKQTRQLTCTQAAEVAWEIMREVKEAAHQQR